MQTGIAFLMAAVGAALIALAVRNWRRGASTGNWPQGDAEIVRSVVVVDKGTESDTYTATIEYAYQIARLPHRGTRVRYGAIGSSNRGAAERTVASYPVGSRHPVF